MNHNLLPILRALLRERSVTRAAETVGMTQPAASASLARLRLMLNDPLLVKAGRRMELSPRAEILLPQVEDLCLRLELLWKSPHFDPRTSKRRFTLTSPDYVQVVLAPKLTVLMQQQAPEMSLRFLDVPVDEVIRHMLADIDFIISIRQSLPASPDDSFEYETLYRDRIVAVVGPQHRLWDATEVSRSDYERDSFLVFVGGAQFLEKRYVGLQNAVRAPTNPLIVSQHYNSLMMIAVSSDCVALIPHHLALLAKRIMPLRVLDADYSDFVIDVCLAWDRRYEADNAHRWMRAQLHLAAEPLVAAPPPQCEKPG